MHLQKQETKHRQSHIDNPTATDGTANGRYDNPHCQQCFFFSRSEHQEKTLVNGYEKTYLPIASHKRSLCLTNLLKGCPNLVTAVTCDKLDAWYSTRKFNGE